MDRLNELRDIFLREETFSIQPRIKYLFEAIFIMGYLSIGDFRLNELVICVRMDH